eukprot:Skav218396  [mRNA]  locus=scaffold790:241631:256287:+ [translate_table: standard]
MSQCCLSRLAREVQEATVKFVGATDFAEGEWLGVELDSKAPAVPAVPHGVPRGVAKDGWRHADGSIPKGPTCCFMEDEVVGCSAEVLDVGFLQVDWHLRLAASGNPSWDATAAWRIGQELSKVVLLSTSLALILLFAVLTFRGLPQKEPQDAKVKDGCTGSWVIYMGLVYTFVFFSTDQYLASLPQMGVDLGASQWLMSASIQTIFAIKGVAGICTAALSDHIGRKPVLLTCSFLLSLATCCCGFAARIEWFLFARLLQALGMAVEPIVWAMTRDYFGNPQERRFMMRGG